MHRREEFLGSRGSAYLFVSTRGKLDGGRVHRVFYELSRQTGAASAGCEPRASAARLPASLRRHGPHPVVPGGRRSAASVAGAVDLGHVYVQGTYWYLSGAPALMTLAMARLERRWGDAS